MRSSGLALILQYSNYKDTAGEEGEGDWKCIWENYG